MKLFQRAAPDPEPEPTVEPGPHLLLDGAVLAAWYVRWALDRELERARRYGRGLAVITAEPELLPGEQLKPEALTIATQAAAKAARSTDLVGRTDDGHVVMIMPEGDADAARTAASRWRDEMWLRSRGVGGQKWEIIEIYEIAAIEQLRIVNRLETPEQADTMRSAA